MGNLDGKVALITGASQGIGRACALELARRGARIALASRNEQKLDEVLAEIVSAGGEGKTFVLDLAQEQSIHTTAKAVIAHFKGVDILVNNAGVTKDTLLLRMRRGDWDQVLTTNLTGAFLMSQAVLSPMMRNRWGRIVNLSKCGWGDGPGGPGQLRCQQSRFGRLYQIVGPRGGIARSDRQCRRSRLHRNCNDCGSR